MSTPIAYPSTVGQLLQWGLGRVAAAVARAAAPRPRWAPWLVLVLANFCVPAAWATGMPISVTTFTDWGTTLLSTTAFPIPVPKPPGAVPGDLMMITFGSSTDSHIATPTDSSWVAVTPKNQTSTMLVSHWLHVVDGTEGANITFNTRTISTSSRLGMFTAVIRGASKTVPAATQTISQYDSIATTSVWQLSSAGQLALHVGLNAYNKGLNTPVNNVYYPTLIWPATQSLLMTFGTGANAISMRHSYIVVSADMLSGGALNIGITASGTSNTKQASLIVLNPSSVDLTLGMTVSSPLTTGATGAYSFTVKNNGSSTDAGPRKLVVTLPTELTFNGAAGSGWSCTTSGQVVTCTHTSASALAAGASAPALTLTVNVAAGASGSVTTSAALSSSDGDANSDDNVASLTTTLASSPSINHFELTSTSWASVACAKQTLTIKACTDSAKPCATPSTVGASVNLGASSGSVWFSPANAATTTVTIPAGQSSVTVDFYGAPGANTLAVTSSTPLAAAAAWCSGGTACVHTGSSSGLVVAGGTVTGGQPTAISVQAVQTTGSGPYTACAPIQNLSGAGLKLWATPVTPATFAGTSTSAGVTVGGTPQVATASTGAWTALTTSTPAANTLGSLSFDSTATTTVWLKHMDTGQFTLSARLDNASPPLSLSGSSSISAVPVGLGVTVPAGRLADSATQTACAGGMSAACDTAAAASPRNASSSDLFSATVAAALWTGAGDTDFSDNPVAPNFSTASAAVGPVLVAPSGGSNGALWGTVSFAMSGGIGNATSIRWGEIGAMRVHAIVPDYLGSQPLGDSKVVGRVAPSYLTTTLTPGCTAFTYAGQPFASFIVRAYNSDDVVSPNYRDGFARTVTLGLSSIWPPSTTGSLNGATISAASFSAGVASASPSYVFTNPATAPAYITVSAVDSDGVSSSGHLQGSTFIRQGRLRLGGNYGKPGTALQLPLAVEYWGGGSWLPSSDDSCTTLSAANVALSNPRTAAGTVSSATTSVSSVALSNGSGQLTLAAPSPASATVSYDVSLNLGSSSADNSCRLTHPTSTGAGRVWLRSLNGTCASTYDRDPSATATFGVYTPESRKLIQLQQVY